MDLKSKALAIIFNDKTVKEYLSKLTSPNPNISTTNFEELQGCLWDLVVNNIGISVDDEFMFDIFDAFFNLLLESIPDLLSYFKYIGDSWFYYYYSLKSISIPENIKHIGNSAFEGCRNLAEVKLPHSLEYIDEYAFYNCKSLDKVIYAGTMAEWANITQKYGCWTGTPILMVIHCADGELDHDGNIL